jgi:Protein of unknown function (DUF3995)
VPPARAASVAGAAVLAGLSALHLAWAAGSSWPAHDRAELAQVAAGTGELPGPVPCLQVAAVLAGAAALVAGVGGDRPVARLGRAAVAAGFLTRGVAGLTGSTHRLVSWTPAERFTRLDRRYYGPLCCAIGVAAVAGRSRSGGPAGR